MRRASVAALKARLSEYLHGVKAGEEVLVTERGRAIARLIPVPLAVRREAQHAALVRTGLLRPARARLPRRFWTQARPLDRDGRALAALLQERAEAR